MKGASREEDERVRGRVTGRPRLRECGCGLAAWGRGRELGFGGESDGAWGCTGPPRAVVVGQQRVGETAISSCRQEHAFHDLVPCCGYYQRASYLPSPNPELYLYSMRLEALRYVVAKLCGGALVHSVRTDRREQAKDTYVNC